MGGTGANEGVDLIDVHDVVITLFLDTVHYLLDPFLKISSELGACDQGTHVDLVDTAAG